MNETVGTTSELLGSGNDQEAVSEAPTAPPNEEAAASGDGLSPGAGPQLAPVTSLENRVRRLEDQVEGLQDTRKLEDRVTERIAKRLERKQSNAAIKVPVAAVAAPSKPPPMAAIAPPTEMPPVVVIQGNAVKQRWLAVDIFTEFRAMLRMFLDARYRVFYMSWQTKVYPVLLLGLIVVSGFTISYVPLIGPVLDRLAELVIAFSLYKVLSREAGRYKEIAPQIRK
jgi:hypothetical protein